MTAKEMNQAYSDIWGAALTKLRDAMVGTAPLSAEKTRELISILEACQQQCATNQKWKEFSYAVQVQIMQSGYERGQDLEHLFRTICEN